MIGTDGQAVQRVIQKIKDLAGSKEDPPILFEWDTANLELFWNKAVGYAAGVGPRLPPNAINGGAHLVGPPNADLLKTQLLEYVSHGQASSPSILGNGRIGLGCTLVQSLASSAFLRGMELEPWFTAVLAHDGANPLPGPLAAVYTPRPRNTKGLLDPVSIGATLWN